MSDEPRHQPETLPARLIAWFRRCRPQARACHSPADIAARPHDRWPPDAGLACDEARRIREQRRLHGIADRERLRGRGL